MKRKSLRGLRKEEASFTLLNSMSWWIFQDDAACFSPFPVLPPLGEARVPKTRHLGSQTLLFLHTQQPQQLIAFYKIKPSWFTGVCDSPSSNHSQLHFRPWELLPSQTDHLNIFPSFHRLLNYSFHIPLTPGEYFLPLVKKTPFSF